MKLISGLFSLVMIALALAFALSNRQSASVSLWPFDVRVEAPLYLLTLGIFVLGLAVGAVVTWIGMLPRRVETRRMGKDISFLRGKLEELQKTIDSQPRGDITPLPPPRKTKWRFRQ